MPKRRNEGVGPAGPIMIVACAVGVLLFVGAAYVAPAIILIGLIYFEFTSEPSAKDIALTSAQAAKLREAEDEIRAIDERLNEMEQEGEGLRRNLDGSYHRGNRRGKALNEELQRLFAAKARLETFAYDARHRPLNAWNRLMRITNLRVALRWTALGYAATALVLYLLGGNIFIAVAISLVLLLAVYKRRRVRVERSAADLLTELERLAAGKDILPDDAVEDGEALAQEASDSAQSPSPPRAAWYEVLGVSANASADEINAAWREKIKKSHPDLVAEMDADFQEMAEHKAKGINAARAEGLSRLDSSVP